MVPQSSAVGPRPITSQYVDPCFCVRDPEDGFLRGRRGHNSVGAAARAPTNYRGFYITESTPLCHPASGRFVHRTRSVGLARTLALHHNTY